MLDVPDYHIKTFYNKCRFVGNTQEVELSVIIVVMNMKKNVMVASLEWKSDVKQPIQEKNIMAIHVMLDMTVFTI